MGLPAARISVDEYLALDAASEGKREYYDGEVVAMAGASPRHNQISLNVALALRRQLDPRGCFVAAADQRTRMAATRAFVYPDVVVSCEPRFEGPRPLTLVNPCLVVEVLSSSTEAHDLSAKLAHYRAADSIQEIVFVHLGVRLVEHHRRVDGARWLVTLVTEGEAVLDRIDARLVLDEIYAGIDALPEEESA